MELCLYWGVMKKYPDWTDFPIESIFYGVGAPFVGIGIYTRDLRFSWPDREGTSKKEYFNWVEHLKKYGYRVPRKYKNAYYKE